MWMLNSDLPIDGWKVNPTARDGFDHALHPHPADPAESLEPEEIDALAEQFDHFQIMVNPGRYELQILVAGGDDGT